MSKFYGKIGFFLFATMLLQNLLWAQEDNEEKDPEKQEKEIKKDPTEINDLLKQLLEEDNKQVRTQPVALPKKETKLPVIELKGKIINSEAQPYLAILQIDQRIYFVKKEDEIHINFENQDLVLGIKEIALDKVEVTIKDSNDTILLR